MKSSIETDGQKVKVTLENLDKKQN